MNRSKYSHNGTICWNCKNACGGCSWSREFKPVEGWTATPRTLYQRKSKDNEMTEVIAFSVAECPKFERG